MLTPHRSSARAQRSEDVVLAACLSVVGLSMAALWLLAKPTSWLSRRVDRAVTLPAVSR